MELIHFKRAKNVGQSERIASVIAGGTFGFLGLRALLGGRSFVAGTSLSLTGAALVWRGLTGYCDFYRMFGINTATQGDEAVSLQEGFRIDRSIDIHASRESVYKFWRDLENLPNFMKYVQSVKKIDDRHSHWTVEGHAGRKIEWDAQITHDVPNDLIAWRSLPGSAVQHAGTVRFEDAIAGRGTKVTIAMQYDPPAGLAGALIAKVLGRKPEQEIDLELHRLKTILEAGELPTSEGQPAGRVEDRTQGAKKSSAEKVDNASEASFPASDPPSHSHINGL